MFRFLFRKRFVCGYVYDIWSGNRENVEYREFRWKLSFKTKEEALLWFKYPEYSRQILYDKKTKVTVREPGRSIEDYLNNLKEKKCQSD